MSSQSDAAQPLEPAEPGQDAEYKALVERTRMLINERRLTVADVPDMLRALTIYAGRDSLVRERFAETDEKVQFLVSGAPPEDWLWLVFDRGAFATGRGPIEQTLRVEFKDDQTMLGAFMGTVNPQVAALKGLVKVTPLARAAPFGEFFSLMSRRLSSKL